MREFAFTVRYDAGVDDLMDLFIEEPRLRARTRSCFATEAAMWRVDHVTGPADALETLDGLYLDESTCNECLDVDGCSSDREHRVLAAADQRRLYYTRRVEIDRCHSLPYLAVDHVGDGVLLEAERSGREYVWRVLMPEETPVGELFDRIERKLQPGLSLELERVSEMTDWNADDGADATLSVTERETLAAAVEAGYYRTPREATVAELAESLDEPHSTVQYRLQRAEEKVIEEFVAD